MHFDVGFGWQPSAYPGVIMLRPVFPSDIVEEVIVGIDEQGLPDYTIWPNPTAGPLNITGDFPLGTVATLYDLHGRSVTSQRLGPNTSLIDIGFASEGLYILELTSPAGLRSIEKVIISR